MSTRYIVTRLAKRNPDIKGKKLYLSKSGLWSLEKERARHFYTSDGAEEFVSAIPKLGAQVERVEA